jgi:hypothetical protein
MGRESRTGFMAVAADDVERTSRKAAASAARAMKVLLSGSSSGVLTTQALPVAKAADSDLAVISSG